MVISLHKTIKYSIKILIILLTISLVFLISYFFNYLKYNNKDLVELETLKIENNNLKEEIKALEQSLNIKPQNNDYLLAKVILRNIHEFYNEIVVLCDTTNVKVGNAVINEEGLIGLVHKMDNNKVYVRLLTGNYNVSVKIKDTYGNLNKNEVTMLDKYSEILPGDVIYTSGLTSIPAGIVVGHVKDVQKNEINTTATITLLDNNNLNYVAILVGES